MPVRRACGLVVLGLVACGLPAAPAMAQEAQADAAVIDATALGIDLSRVERFVRSTEEQTEQDGLMLNVFLTVFGEAEPIDFLPRGDNEPFFVGPPADGPPTHADLMRIRTPREFRSPVMDLSAGLAWLMDQFRSGNLRQQGQQP